MNHLKFSKALSRFGLLLCLCLMATLTLTMTACGGAKTTPVTQAKPLDPQGNWLFSFAGPHSFSLAGQLYELSPPVVTSNPIGPIGTAVCSGSFTINGQASNTNDITLTAQQIGVSGQRVTLNLTGTIAVDQAHISGNWTTSTAGDCLSSADSGTWTAQLLTAVTGNWSGTLSSSTTDLTVTAALTENVDQTSATMGQVTGTITLLGSPCFPTADTLNIAPWNSTTSPGVHGGETLIIVSSPDAAGVSVQTVGTVTPNGATFTPVNGFTIHGGSCDGQSFTVGTLSH